jgi:hypothetical protein
VKLLTLSCPTSTRYTKAFRRPWRTPARPSPTITPASG